MMSQSDVLNTDHIAIHFGDESVIVFSRGVLIAALERDDEYLADGLAQVLKEARA